MTSAIVTGAAAGIGRSIATRLAKDGYRMVLIDVADRLAEAAREVEQTGAPAVSVQADLTEAAGLEAIHEVAKNGGDPVRILVNCAGITRDARLVKMTDEDFAAVLHVNLGAALRLIRLVTPLMTGGGSIINISSRTYLGNFGQYNYTMSKGGLVGLTRALALELAPEIRVNAVAPGLIATEMVMAIPEEIRDRMVAAIPLQRTGRPEEIAETVAFLASDRSSYLTGQVVIPDGGRSLSR